MSADNFHDFSDLADEIASYSADATQASAGGADYVPPAIGKGAKIILTSYLELGEALKTSGQSKGKKQKRAWLGFEIHGKHWPVEEKEDGTKIPKRITVKLNHSLNEKAGYFKLFRKMNEAHGGKATSFVQLLGKGWLADVDHFMVKGNDGKEQAFASLRNSDAELTIRAGRVEMLDDEGEVVSKTVPMPAPVGGQKVFIWNAKPEHMARMWKSIEVPAKDGESPEDFRKKQSTQNEILKALDFKGSPIETWLLSAGVDFGIPDAVDDKGSKEDAKAVREAAKKPPQDEDDILNGVGD